MKKVVGNIMVYTDSYYGELFVLVTDKVKGNYYNFWSFIGEQSWGCCPRSKLRHITAKEYNKVQNLMHEKFLEIEQIKLALQNFER